MASRDCFDVDEMIQMLTSRSKDLETLALNFRFNDRTKKHLTRLWPSAFWPKLQQLSLHGDIGLPLSLAFPNFLKTHQHLTCLEDYSSVTTFISYNTVGVFFKNLRHLATSSLSDTYLIIPEWMETLRNVECLILQPCGIDTEKLVSQLQSMISLRSLIIELDSSNWPSVKHRMPGSVEKLCLIDQDDSQSIHRWQGPRGSVRIFSLLFPFEVSLGTNGWKRRKLE
jgi:hypothetical protein